METQTKIIIGVIIVAGILIYLYKDDISTYLSFKSSKSEINDIKNKAAPDMSNSADL